MSSTFPRAPWSTPLITLPMGCLEVWEILLGNSSRQGQVEQFFQLLDCLGEGRKEAKSSSSVWVYGHINYIMTHINTCMFVTALSTKPCAAPSVPQHWMQCPYGVCWGVMRGRQRVALLSENSNKKLRLSAAAWQAMSSRVCFTALSGKCLCQAASPNACVRMQCWGWKVPGTEHTPIAVVTDAIISTCSWQRVIQQRTAQRSSGTEDFPQTTHPMWCPGRAPVVGRWVKKLG